MTDLIFCQPLPNSVCHTDSLFGMHAWQDHCKLIAAISCRKISRVPDATADRLSKLNQNLITMQMSKTDRCVF